MIHAISTGQVKITERWRKGEGQGLMRLVNTLFDKEFSEWLPIWCFVIEHEAGLIVIDTGISDNANDPIYFPPFMPLVQRAAKFQISKADEIGNQMRACGLNPEDVCYVIMTHLHQDHDGGIQHFPNAEFIVSQKEWDAATGFAGRMGGYLNHRWADWFSPTIVDFNDAGIGAFPNSYRLLQDVTLVPTYGHSAGHLSVIYQHGDTPIIFGGDVAYTEDALYQGILDGVSGDLELANLSMQRMSDFVRSQEGVFLPSHEPDVEARLAKHLDAHAIFSR